MATGYGNQEPTAKTQPLTGGDRNSQGSISRELWYAAATPEAQLAGVAPPNSRASSTDVGSAALTANYKTLNPNALGLSGV